AQASQEIYDSAFLLKAVDPSGRIVGLSVLDPGAVEMKYADLGMGKPIVIYNLATTKGIVTLAYNEILHIKAGLPIPGALRGVSPVKAARETIGTGMAARKFGARYFGAGSHVSGMIEAPGAFSKDTADRLKESMEKKHGGVSKSHALGILFGGAKWIPVEHDPTKAQGLETQKYTDIQISSLFGIPAEYVTAAMEGAKGYVTGLYQRQMLWYQTGLFARITRNERAFSSLLPRPAYMKLNVSSWLRMDPEQRVAFYQAGQLGEWLTVNDIRNLEDMNPLPGGDVPLHSVQWQENTPPDPPA
ncbi:MAG: phage portal protein, partial [Bacteroidales bacterium]|nr:phage portal protein [Bacteroidales bacterium]